MSKLRFYYSVMNAGKTLHLLQVNHNYETHFRNTIILKPEIDQRDGKNKVRSRLGVETEALEIKPKDNLFHIVKDIVGDKKYYCVLVDETQFLTKQHVEQLCDIVDDLDIPVMAYGIRTDAYGNLFEGSKALFELADEINEIKQICFCGRKATMIKKYDKNGDEVTHGEVVDLGKEEKYVSMCRKHWKSMKNFDMIKEYLNKTM